MSACLSSWQGCMLGSGSSLVSRWCDTPLWSGMLCAYQCGHFGLDEQWLSRLFMVTSALLSPSCMGTKLYNTTHDYIWKCLSRVVCSVFVTQKLLTCHYIWKKHKSSEYVLKFIYFPLFWPSKLFCILRVIFTCFYVHGNGWDKLISLVPHPFCSFIPDFYTHSHTAWKGTFTGLTLSRTSLITYTCP